MAASGNISKNQPQSSSISYHNKDISELFPTVPTSSYFILIEGAPGIGKTVLSKEIACQWAQNKLLKFKKLVFLLYLRDPAIKSMIMLEQLAQYVLNNNKKATELSDYLFETKGKDLTIILDGYDEMSEEDRNDSLVAKIINRRVLPECDLVITSRPTVSLHLRDIADCRVEVLGFTEENRLDYIQHALEGSHEKIEILQSYLRSNTTINALCYVPLNMTILLCLFEDIDSSQSNIDSIKEIGLPNTQTEMYENFILMTITRYINRSNKTISGKYLKITELPDPYNKMFNKLLHLAYYALTKDKIVFNSDEEFIQQFCRNLKSGNCEGLGLLKITNYVKIVSFHFLHFSIQEYLAAYYIASQSTQTQSQLLKDTFWDIHYFNTWIMYVGMTGGKKTAWKHFISGNWFMLFTKISKSSKISKKYLNDKIKSLHLFQCFAEIGSKELVGTVFKDKIIDLSNQTLLPSDINTICFFLLRSANKRWIKLDLSNCNIGITGSDILCKTFLDKSRDILSIDKVDLSHNQLQSHSILELLDVIKVWHASEAVICGTHDDENYLFEFCLSKFPLYDDNFSHAVLIGPYIFAHNVNIHNLLINSANVIIGLYLYHCNYLPSNIKYGDLSHKLNLSKLHIIGDNIPCYYIVALIQTMQEVDSVYIYDHTLSDKDVEYISLMLSKKNLNNLGVWVVTGSTKILGNVCKLNKLQCIEALNLTKSIKILCSKSGMCIGKFDECIPTESKSMIGNFFDLLYGDISKCGIAFCLLENNILIANGVAHGKIREVLSSHRNLISIHIVDSKLIATELLTAAELIVLLSKQESLEKLYISDSSLDIHNVNYVNLLNHMLRLKELFIHTTNSSCIFNFDLFQAHKYHPNISILLITNTTLIGHNPSYEQISLSLKLEPNLTAWKINNLPIKITDESVDEIEMRLFHNLSLQQLEINHNNFLSLNILNMLKSASNLVRINISYTMITDTTVSSLVHFLIRNPSLQEINLSSNHISASNAIKIFNGMENISNLEAINVSNNIITDEAAESIVTVLSHNNKLKSLNLSSNYFSCEGFVKIFNEMRNIVSLKELSIGSNEISTSKVEPIANFLLHSLKLEILDLSNNLMQELGIIKIFEGMKNMFNLRKINIQGNVITKEAATILAFVISQNTKLEEINIGYTYLQTESAVKIFQSILPISSLTQFNIAQCTITNEAAEYIVRILYNSNELRQLNLSHTKIKHFNFSTSNLTNLQELDLSYTNLQTSSSINNLNLKKCNISANYIPSSELDGIASLFLELQELDLSFNDLSTEFNCADYFLIVLNAATKLVQLDLSYNKLSSVETGYILCQAERLFINMIKLNLSGNEICNGAAAALANALAENSKLKELSLCDAKLQSEEINKIFGKLRFPHLTKLYISHNSITDEAADVLADFVSNSNGLEELDISHNYLKCAGIIKICKTDLSNLTVFNVGYNNITFEAAADVASFLSRNLKLQVLDISCSDVLCSTIFTALQSVIILSVLKLNNCYLINESADELANVLLYSSLLQEFDLSYNNLETLSAISIFKGMKNISHLIAINISHNRITDEAAENIAIVLSCNKKLQALDLSCNYFTSEGLIEIFKFECLKNIIYLKKLNVSSNKININAASSIGTVLSLNSTLEELDLSNNLMQAPAATIIFLGMQNITNLKAINISHNMIGCEAADELAAVLSHNNNLQSLDVSHNNLNSDGCKKVMDEMNYKSYLKKIDISYNQVTSAAADSIAAFLSINSKLEELILSGNNFYQSYLFKNIYIKTIKLTKLCISLTLLDADDITTLLALNTKMEDVDLSNNELLSSDIITICYSMKNILNLKRIDISRNCVDCKAADDIANVLSQNINLQELYLNNNNLQSQGIITLFSKMSNVKLTHLDISSNKITDEATDDIATFLLRNNNLKVLDLCNNLIKSRGARKIFDGAKNINLQELYLNKI